jgi:hypothetical protein
VAGEQEMPCGNCLFPVKIFKARTDELLLLYLEFCEWARLSFVKSVINVRFLCSNGKCGPLCNVKSTIDEFLCFSVSVVTVSSKFVYLDDLIY